MRTALGDDDALNRFAATGAGCTCASVDLVPVLETAFAPVAVDVVGDGGAARFDGFVQDGVDGVVKFVELLRAEMGGDGVGVDARGEEAFVGVDVAESAEYFLIEQQRLDAFAPAAEVRGEFGGGHLKWVRPLRGQFGGPTYTAEAADVVVEEFALVERKDGAGVGRALAVEEELAGHAEMHLEHAAVAMQEDVFSEACDGADGCTNDGSLPIFDGSDSAAGEMRRERADYVFDFGTFGHLR